MEDASSFSIKEHATVVGSDGGHVGTVDHVLGDQIKLTKNDSPDGQHHLIPFASVGGVNGNVVKLKQPAAQVKLMGDRNFGLHLKDHDNKRGTDVVYGKGVLDVKKVLDALKAVKFTGTISIEYEANPDDPSPDVRACLDVFKEVVKKA